MKSTADSQDFYIVRHAVSDAAPFWFDYILVVSPTRGTSVKVREIRIAPRDNNCGDTVLVKAVEREMPRESLRLLTGSASLCRTTDKTVTDTIDRFRGNTVTAIDDSARFVVVAHCSNEEHVLRFPFPEEVQHLKRLRRKAPDIARLWDLYYHIHEKAFGEGEIFYHISPDQDTKLQQLGSQYVAELRSGKFG